MAENPWVNNKGGLESPARHAVAITPHDSTNLDPPIRAFYVGVSGDVSVEMEGSGSAVVFKSMAVGWHPLRVTRINSTSTTATDIVGVW